MKKIVTSLLVVFFLLTLTYAILQGSLGKKLVRNILTSAFSASGYEVRIGQIEGTLPHQINLKEVDIHAEGKRIQIATIQMRPVLWRLLKNQIAFTDIQAKKISIDDGTPFDFTNARIRMNKRFFFLRAEVDSWSLFLRFQNKRKIAEFSASNHSITLRGHAEFLPKLFADIELRSDPFVASINIDEENDTYNGKAVWMLSRLEGIGPIEGTVVAKYKDQAITGTISAPFANGTIDLNYQNQKLQGNLSLDVENFQALHVSDAYGKLHAKALLDSLGLHVDAIFTDFYYKDLFAGNLSVYSDLQDPFGSMKGLLDVQAQHLKWKSIDIDNGSFETKFGEENSPYKLFIEGNLGAPFEIYSDGMWTLSTILIENLHGEFQNSPIVLNEPVQITNTKNILRIPDVHLRVKEGSAYLHLDHKNNTTLADLRLIDVPLSTNGTITLHANLKEKNKKIQGKFDAQSDTLGNISGNFNNHLIQIKAKILNPNVNADLSIPIHLSLFPLEGEILYHKEAKGVVEIDTNIREFLDYFDVGAHHLEGHLFGKIAFHNTLFRPTVKGKLTFENGLYENYYTGTNLSQIHAEIIAKNNSLFLKSFTSQDRPSSGSVTAKGKLKLLKSDLYPFRLKVDLDNLLFSEIDLVNATASGKIELEGNLLSALAKGDVFIHNARLSIPDHIARPLPDLEVTYRNAIHPVPKKASIQPYPMRLDLNIAAPADIYIGGRGLESHWNGDFQLGGTLTELAAKGKLELIKGDFNFSTRNFKLTEGALIFSGIEHQMPKLNLAAQMETKGITITAKLIGPLDDPQLTLLSNPPLPLGSIMSHLLFGQDISEISGFQALQIANALASFAGTGPDLMESTRKTIGVDKLEVITTPTEEGSESIAIKVGKYISKGVLVTYTQGPDESSTNISVEIELKNNLVFQIESDQRQEQGKFTLKWNLNY